MFTTIEQQESTIKERNPRRFKIRVLKTFPSSGSAIHEVRKFVEDNIQTKYSQEFLDNAVLVASEGATNAVKHATPKESPQEFVVGIGKERRRIQNGLKKGGEIIFIGDNSYTMGKPPKNEENGNGSFLMQQFTTDMGYTTHFPRRVKRHAPAIQKIVWGVIKQNAKTA